MVVLDLGLNFNRLSSSQTSYSQWDMSYAAVVTVVVTAK